MQNALELTNFIPSIPPKNFTDLSPYREGTQIGFTFLVPVQPDSPKKPAVKHVCV